MASTINASTTLGLISTADTSGVLQLQTANTTAVTVNANQTVSLAVGTANGVTYLNGSKVLTSGSALTFDGTNLGVGNASPRTLFDTLSGTANTTGDVLGQAIITGPDVAPAGTGGSGNLVIQTNSNQAANVGGTIAFGGRATDSSTVGRGYAVIKGAKENSTSANRDGYFAIFTRTEASGQTEKLRVDSAGNLGLGVTPGSTSASGTFQMKSGGDMSFLGNGNISSNTYYNGTNYIYATTAASTRYRMAAGQHQWYTAASGTAGNAISFTQAMTLGSSGDLLLGTTTNRLGEKLHVLGNGIVTSSAENTNMGLFGTFGSANLIIGAFNNLPVEFRQNNTERMRLDSSGNLLVGTTTATGNGFVIQPNGSDTSVPLIDTRGNSSSNSLASIRVYSTNLNQDQFYVGYGGTVYARSTSISGLSDQREKENIRTLETGLAQVLALQPRRFDWKNGQGENVAGFVAQEVQGVLPDLIDEYKLNDTETRMALKMGDMIPTLVKAIQEQQALIVSLKARLDAANL